MQKNYYRNIRNVWFGYFLFSFSLKIENGDENALGWIFKNIFSDEQKTENNKISFSVFSIEIRNLKNIFSFGNTLFLFLESRTQDVKPNIFSKF